MGILGNKTVKNSAWIIGEKIIQMLFSFFVGLLTARYLGPNNYGLINYAATFTTFSYALCTLGISSIIVKNFVDFPQEQGTTIGTSIALRGIASTISLIVIAIIVAIVDGGEKLTFYVVVLYSIGPIFQSFDTLYYWFQNRLESKYSSLASFIAYLIMSVYKILLLVLGKSVVWFALSATVEYIAIAIFLLVVYKKKGGPKFSFSFSKAKQLLGKSYHFILTGLMISIYNGSDKFMLKHLVNNAEVGYYSTAMHLSNIWCFVLSAIITSVMPSIFRLHKQDYKKYEQRNKQLYVIVFYISSAVAIIFTLFSEFFVGLLYGAEYLPAASSLKVLAWLVVFSYLGVARDSWIVCEDKQKYLKYLYLIAAVSNVAMNALIVPILGALGAAIASLITQILTSMVIPCCIKPLRRNVKLMFEAIIFKGVSFKREE